jgi:hypothetical protein
MVAEFPPLDTQHPCRGGEVPASLRCESCLSCVILLCVCEETDLDWGQ